MEFWQKWTLAEVSVLDFGRFVSYSSDRFFNVCEPIVHSNAVFVWISKALLIWNLRLKCGKMGLGFLNGSSQCSDPQIAMVMRLWDDGKALLTLAYVFDWDPDRPSDATFASPSSMIAYCCNGKRTTITAMGDDITFPDGY
jgi:hypothetical protein